MVTAVDFEPFHRNAVFDTGTGEIECFGVFARLIFVEQPQKDGGVVKNYWGMGSRSGKSLKYQA
jgi:hypothetical protein